MISTNTRLFGAVAKVMSTDEARYYLNGVYVTPHHQKGILLVATDGHRLLCIHDPDGECTKPPAIIKLPKPMLDSCNEYRPDYDEDGEACGRVLAETRKLTITDDGIAEIDGFLRTASDCRIDGTFPDWRRVLPKFNDGPRSLAPFNGKYIHDFAEIAELLGDTHARIKLIGGDTPNDPALVLFSKSPNALGVLMPTREAGEVGMTVPAFALLPEKVAA